ncbi:MAG TPA: aminotransferase class I/II-fold pyridoxal phosphate-dependent enzyme [Gammaproteobacteria bacterium]|nr:aminotransferase class I/II-fold pyridoxal phosphate-dependent enzyme [Gammaproteobacteria bacterium]
MKKETRVTHQPDVELPDGNRSLLSPIYQSVKFTFPTIAESLTAEARSSGFEYTRDSNPTTRQLELLCAELQDRDDAIAVGTGMASIWLALLGNLTAGDRLVIFVESYRPTRVAARKFLPRYGIAFDMVSLHDPEALEDALGKDDTKAILFESPTNPMLQIPDIEAILELARKHGVVTILDNTFAGLHNHGQYPVDFFVHSLTKFAGGHGDVMGGAVIASADRIRFLKPLAVNMGATLDPGAASAILRGLRTYYLRYERHCRNAKALAEYLETRAEVERVLYPGLQSHPDHALAAKQMHDFGGVLAFSLKDADRDRTWAFIDALKLHVTASSLGSTDSLAAPVQLYFASDLSEAEQSAAQIDESMVRLAVGIEHIDDLIADVAQALDAVFA